MKKSIYRHYGSDILSRSKVITPKKTDFPMSTLNKPGHGLWGCPLDSNYSWYDWCIGNDFHVDRLDTYFDFVVDNKAKILHVECFDDIKKYIKRFDHASGFSDKRICWNSIVNEGYDGFELHMCGRYMDFQYNEIFSAWDVDSIVVWNPDVIVPVYAREHQVINFISYDTYVGLIDWYRSSGMDNNKFYKWIADMYDVDEHDYHIHIYGGEKNRSMDIYPAQCQPIDRLA